MSCPDCLKGHVHEGEPSGRVEKLYGRETYIAEPPEGKTPVAIVVILTDAMGWEFSNNRLLADRYAKMGEFLVYVPDFMDGHPCPDWIIDSTTHLTVDAGIASWLWKPWYIAKVAAALVPFILRNHPKIAYPKVAAFLSSVRADRGVDTHIGIAGFCWGGTLAILLTHETAATSTGQPLADAVFVAHPTGLTVPADVEKCVRPLSFAIGDKDMAVSMKKVEIAQKILEKRKDEVKSEVVVYPGARHGFASRFDPLNKNLVEQERQADEQAVKWFSMNFGV